MGAETTRKLHRDHKLGIQAGMLLQRVHSAALGEVEMTQTQMMAAKLFLAKTIPDLKAVEHSGETTTNHNMPTFIFGVK